MDKSDISDIFDSFYSRFVLRDFMAKAVPGMLLVGAVYAALTSWDDTVTIVKGLSFYGWLGLFGIAWVAGFAIQAVGECKRVLGKPHDGCLVKRYPRQIKFGRLATPEEKQQYERLGVIKEACGNTFVSIYIILALTVADTLLEACLESSWNLLYERWMPTIPGVVVVLGGAWFLRKMRSSHAKKERAFEKFVLRAGPKPTRNQDGGQDAMRAD